MSFQPAGFNACLYASALQKHVKEEVAARLISSFIDELLTNTSNLNSVYIEIMTMGDEINKIILLFIGSVFHFIINDRFWSIF